MKSTGITRPIDELGRMVLPMELRKSMNLQVADRMEIFTEANTIILRKYQPGCIFCNSVDGLTDFKGQHICRYCKADIIKGCR